MMVDDDNVPNTADPEPTCQIPPRELATRKRSIPKLRRQLPRRGRKQADINSVLPRHIYWHTMQISSRTIALR